MRTLSPSSPVAVTSNNNEHARHHVDMGVEVGSADLTLRQRRGDVTHFLYLELKRKNGILSDSQKQWNADFDLHYASDNCKRAVAYGLIEAQEIIMGWLSSVTESNHKSNPACSAFFGFSTNKSGWS